MCREDSQHEHPPAAVAPTRCLSPRHNLPDSDAERRSSLCPRRRMSMPHRRSAQQRLAVRVREFTHAIEPEIEIWHDVGLARSAGFAVLAIDPARGEADFVGDGVIVEQALCGVQDPVFANAVARETVDQVFEVPRAWLVRADVFCRHDAVELHFEVRLVYEKLSLST